MDTKGKIKRVFSGIAKLAALLVLLFFFVCSLDLLSSSFRLVGGRTTGKFTLALLMALITFAITFL